MAEGSTDALDWIRALVPETRTDPWRWYCSICTAAGEADERVVRDLLGLAHVREVHRSLDVESDTYGRLMHVWSPEQGVVVGPA